MTDFWLAVGVMLLIAPAFLWVPILRARRGQAEEDRTALNVALYQERLAELRGQAADGVLDAGRLARGEAEAARELLADTAGAEPPRQADLGKRGPLLAALLVPVLGLGLYLHYGASDRVRLTREFAHPPSSMADLTQRLERAVAAQPESAQGLFLLGRTYMSENRAVDAAPLFERAVALAGRQPELLGQWAQALYFAAGKQWSGQIQAIVDEALQGDPREVTSLGLLGIAAYEGRQWQRAIDYWQRLQALLPAEDASRAALQGGIDKARAQLGAVAAAPVATASIRLRVRLAPALQGQVRPGDSVFVFARAVKGPPMPLAVKRLSVAELPAEITLSDDDAMMAALKLSNFAEVQLLARVSRAGQATRGEWIGRSPEPVASTTRAVQSITIDSPDSPISDH
jgi:cytochrome c-type biogenesis protein CcmH